MRKILGLLGVVTVMGLAGCNQHTPYPTENQPSITNPQNASNAPVTAASCTLPHGNGSGEHCGFEDTKFLEQIENGIYRPVREHPEYFDLNDGGPCGRCYRILDPGGY